MSDQTELFEMAGHFRTLLKSMTQEWKKNMVNNLSITQFKLLYKLDGAGNMKVSELAESLCLTSGAITGLVDKLLVSNYVDRVRAEDDRRVVYIELTAKGKAVLEQVLETQKVTISTYFNSLPEEDIQHLKRIFAYMHEKTE